MQNALNRVARNIGVSPLRVDGLCGNKTIDTIRRFQISQGIARPSSLIQRNDSTAKALGLSQAAAPHQTGTALSGAAWWHANQAKWPNENRLSVLKEPFRSNINQFIGALEGAGAKVSVTTTTRSFVRAQLMLYSSDVGKGNLAPNAVPAIPGVPINWDHGDVTKSRNAARDMARLFGIARPPVLTSNHFKGLAVDMNIQWKGNLTILKKDKSSVTVSSIPRNGTNPELQKVAASYGVYHKVPHDYPHWSINGH